MWELISFFISLGVFFLVLEFWLEPRKILREFGIFRGTHEKVSALENRVAELESQIKKLKENSI